MTKRLKGVVGTPLSGFTKTEYDRHELKPWQRFAYVCDVNDLVIHVSRGLLEPDEINAACNATILIERMLRRYNDRGRLP